MKLIFLTLFAFSMVLGGDFITKDEYAKMLYKNPRGIGCHLCHGKRGEGKILGKYRDGNKEVIVKAPNIRHLDFTTFKKALEGKKNRLMPRYFLTLKEIKLLFYYLHKERR